MEGQDEQLDERVTSCFRAVFPDLSDEQILGINRSEQSGWDSLATMNLFSVLEEEFECRLEDSDLEHLDGFVAAREAVQRATNVQSG